ncbi:MAG TPA: hypothetical protein VJQ59_18230 [Candidatus Sulfotelmatobacter sp.]|nr:hypothetical protein [Candidatus Sulfotelmatobacter sp.]
MRTRLCTAIFCLLFLSSGAFAQRIALSADLGYETFQFGDNNSGYTYAKRSAEFVNFDPQLILFGSTNRESGWVVTAGGDIHLPFDSSDATGVPIEFAGSFLLNNRIGPMGFGFGFEGRDVLLPNDTGSSFTRPSQFLFGVPFMAKFTFGPGHRAYVQGGGTLYFANYSQNVASAFGQTVVLNSSDIKLGNCFTQSCGDIKVNGGYVFGHTAIKGGYTYRAAHFNISNNSGYDPGIMDFHENQISGGIVLTY